MAQGQGYQAQGKRYQVHRGDLGGSSAQSVILMLIVIARTVLQSRRVQYQ